jgi:hypothetical protein
MSKSLEIRHSDNYKLFDTTYALPPALVSYRNLRRQLTEAQEKFDANLTNLFKGPLGNPYDFKNAIFKYPRNGMSLCGFLNIASQFPNDAGQDALTVIAAILERHGYSASVLDTADRSPLMAEWARIAAMVEIYEKACESVRQHRIANAEKVELKRIRAAGKSNETKGFFGRMLVVCMGPLGVLVGSFFKWVFHRVIPSLRSASATAKARKEVEGNHIGLLERKFFAPMKFDSWSKEIRSNLAEWYGCVFAAIKKYIDSVEVPGWGVPSVMAERLKQLAELDANAAFEKENVLMHVRIDPFDLSYAVAAVSVLGDSVTDLRRLQRDIGNNWHKACRTLIGKYASTIDYGNETSLLQKQHVVKITLLPLASDEKSNPADKLLSKISRKLTALNRKACSVCGYQCTSRAATDMSRSELVQIKEVLNGVNLYPIDELEKAIKKFEDKRFKSEFASEILRRMRIRRDYALTVDGYLFQTKEGATALYNILYARASKSMVKRIAFMWRIWPGAISPASVPGRILQVLHRHRLPKIVPIDIENELRQNGSGACEIKDSDLENEIAAFRQIAHEFSNASMRQA